MAHHDAALDSARVLERIMSNESGPLLFHNAAIATLDPLIGTVTGDLLVGGAVIVGVGPGIVTAAGDDGAVVVDVTGCTVTPLVIDMTSVFGQPQSVRTTSLKPGNRASFAVLRGGRTVAEAVAVIEQHPEQGLAMIMDGRVAVWEGAVISADAFNGAEQPSSEIPATGDSRAGVWVDTTGFLEQELRADGSYDETRDGRPHAYEGRYWIEGNRVDYLDDLGFWAFGEFVGNELHHAGYVMTLRN